MTHGNNIPVIHPCGVHGETTAQVCLNAWEEVEGVKAGGMIRMSVMRLYWWVGGRRGTTAEK